MDSVLQELLNGLDAVYQGMALWYGMLAAVVGFMVCWLLPWQVRWLLPLLLIATTVLAVVGGLAFAAGAFWMLRGSRQQSRYDALVETLSELPRRAGWR